MDSRGDAPESLACLIGERKLERYPVLIANNPGDVTLAAGVLDQVYCPRPHMYFLPIRNFQLSFAAERNDILAPWSSVPILDGAGPGAMQLCSHRGHQFEHLVRAACVELGFGFFSVCLTVRSCV